MGNRSSRSPVQKSEGIKPFAGVLNRKWVPVHWPEFKQIFLEEAKPIEEVKLNEEPENWTREQLIARYQTLKLENEEKNMQLQQKEEKISQLTKESLCKDQIIQELKKQVDSQQELISCFQSPTPNNSEKIILQLIETQTKLVQSVQDHLQQLQKHQEEMAKKDEAVKQLRQEKDEERRIRTDCARTEAYGVVDELKARNKCMYMGLIIGGITGLMAGGLVNLILSLFPVIGTIAGVAVGVYVSDATAILVGGVVSWKVIVHQANSVVLESAMHRELTKVAHTAKAAT